MRLTLRTLLAWLDNVLPAGEQAELAEKVAASAAAPVLIERIRRVVEQPTLSAPPTAGRGLAADANSVAEYLDNTLPSEQLEAFERLCIESDLHLAEVAACHGLLADVAGDPQVSASLDEAGRHRLLGAMNHRSALLAAAAQRREAVANARMMRDELDGRFENPPPPNTPEVAVGPRPSTARPGKSSRMAWLSAITAVSLLAVLGAVLGRTVGCAVDRGRPQAGLNAAVDAAAPPVVAAAAAAGQAAVPQPPAAPTAAAGAMHSPAAETQSTTAPVEPAGAPTGQAQPPAEPPPAEPPATEPPPTVASDPKPVDPSDRQSAVQAGEPVASASATAVAPAPTPAGAPRVPQGDALAIAAPLAVVAPAATGPLATVPTIPGPTAPGPTVPGPTVPGPTVPGPAGAAAAGQDAAAAAAIGFVGDGGLLLHRVVEDGQQAWARFPADSPLGGREEMLVPPGFRPSITVRDVTIRLLPCTRATVSLDPDGTPRLEVVFGRAVAQARPSDARLSISAGGMSGTVMAGLSEPVAIHVELQRPPGVDPAAEPARIRAGIAAVRGGIKWRQAAGNAGLLEGITAEGMLESRTAIEWNSLEPGRVAVVRHTGALDWAEGLPGPERVEQRACEALAAKVAATAPLGRALRELSTDRRGENRMIAVETLALLGEYDDLIELLCEDKDSRKLKENQWLALEAMTVPLAMARGANAAARLRKAFEDKAPDGKAGLLQAMARGFSDEQLAGGADATLVEALGDSDLVVRRYAIKCLVDITQPSASDRLRYHPDAPPNLRKEDLNWWKGQLDKGLIRRPSAAGAAAGPPPG